MDQGIAHGYENGNRVIHDVPKHTENMNVDKEGFQDDENLNLNQNKQGAEVTVDMNSFKTVQGEAPAKAEPNQDELEPNRPSGKENETLENVPGEPFDPQEEEKSQINPEENNSAHVLEQQAENEHHNAEEEHSFSVVDEPISCPQEKETVEEQVCESASTEQYAESNNGNFISQYESETNQVSEDANVEVTEVTEQQEDTKVELGPAVNEVETVVEEQQLVEEIVTEVVDGESLVIAEEIPEPVEEVSNVSDNKEMEVVESIVGVPDSQMEVVEETIDVTGPDTAETEVTEVETGVHDDFTVIEGSETVDISITESVEETAPTEEVLEIETHSEDMEVDVTEETAEETPQQPAPRGRKTRRNEIPMHLLGVDISKPVDQVPNGRQMPKPRLGVKVPYRNLTSQIISKEELEKEIIERSRAKEEATSKSDLRFARSLTQRLASKIAPAPEKGNRKEKRAEPPAVKEVSVVNDEVEAGLVEAQNISIEEQIIEVEKQVENAQAQVEAAVDDTKIQNDDDLLAILEGEGEEMPVLPKEVPEVNENDGSNLKMLEREIALQQLQELPHQVPRQRIFKSRQAKIPAAPLPTTQPPPKLTKVEKPRVFSPPKQTKSDKPPVSLLKPHQSPEKTNPSSVKLYSSPSPMKEVVTNESPVPRRQPIEVEPQVKVNMVLKTYSRKRKTSDAPEFDVPSPKRTILDDAEFKPDKTDPLAMPADVYVTKSSRVIKKKVIWDPDDEVPARSPKPTVRPAEVKSKAADLDESTGEKSSDKKSVTSRVSERKLSSDSKASDKKSSVDKSIGKKTASEKVAVGKSPEQKGVKKVEKGKPQATRNESPKTKTPVKSKRGLSEVDRLLMDEGAVKMLYELKSTEDSPATKKKKDFISIEKAEKEIIKKANQLKNDLVQNTSGSSESPKTLRKKEGPATVSPPLKPAVAMERKMSKDSTRSSVHTPPRSPSFQFSSHSQSSMLIRRRSSSSISSVEDADMDFVPKFGKKKSDGPKLKKAKKATSDSPRPGKEEDIASETETPEKESPNKPAHKITKASPYKSFTVRKSGKQIVIDLNYIDEKCFFDVKVLEELTAALKKCGKDKDCTVVLITSTGKAFCLGLDYGSLVASKENERIEKCSELAERVGEFLLCLFNFPKILIAGVQGDCVGLGVTMLPLFDMIIASDKATFSTTYARLGCLPEAGFLLSYPNLCTAGLATELLYAGQTLNADEALRRGLISKLCWPEKYKDTLNNIVNSVSHGSKQCLESTKRQLRSRMLKDTEAAIKSEKDILVSHWTSAECQENFAKIN
nr:titin [Leptinotarsa decemlineata]